MLVGPSVIGILLTPLVYGRTGGPSWSDGSTLGDAAQVVVTAEAAECFMHQHGERPRHRTDLELVTVKYQPGMNVYQHESPP
jgi:hypothetical protein